MTASKFITSPPWHCPDCGSPNTTPFGDDVQPGDRANYVCNDCGWLWNANVPEPPDRYEGDGVFAENH